MSENVGIAAAERVSIVAPKNDAVPAGWPLGLTEPSGPDGGVWANLMDFVLDMSHIGAWELDLSDHVVRRSRHLDRIFGYESPLPEWTHETFVRHVLPEDVAMAEEAFRKGPLGGGELSLECRIRRADGEIRWIWITGRRRQDPSGMRRIAGIVQDITRRKISEEALRLSEERLKKAFVSTPDSFAINKLGTGEMVAVNHGFETIFGYTESEAIGKSSRDLGLWADYSQRTAMMDLLEREGVVHNFEVAARRKDGAVFPALISAASVGDGDDALMVAIVKDVSDLRRAERLLRLTQFSVDHAGDSVFWTNADGLLVYVSESTCLSLGYTRDELLVMTLFDLDPHFTPERWVEDWGVLASRGSMTVEGTHRRKDGSLFPVEIKATCVVFEGEAYNCVFARDISERKETERRLEESLALARESETATLKVLSSVTELRDPYTAGHQRRVAEICVAIAGRLGVPPERRRGLEVAALLHDVGKVSVPIEILACPGHLTPVQCRLVEGHVQAGYEILSDMTGPSPVAQIVLQHHERLDGSGYPAGLKGDEIRLEARILAVADTAEAMSSDRPYRPAQGKDAARRELEANRGVLYDPDVVDAYLEVLSEDLPTVP